MKIVTITFCLGIFFSYGFCDNPHELANDIVQRPFVENKGQWDPEIKFRMEISGGFVFFQPHGLTYLFHEEIPDVHSHGHPTGNSPKYAIKTIVDKNQRFHSVKVRFKDCGSETTELIGVKSSTSYLNYFKGANKEDWVSDVKSYSEIHYKSIYTGISFKYYIDGGQLKYDIIVEAGANPNDVKFEYQGHDEMVLKGGELEVRTSIHTISEESPISYQIIGGTRVEISSQFVLTGDLLGFDLPNGYDRSQKLIIDPRLVFSSFSGVTADNWGFTASFDSKGNTYSGGIASVQYGGNIIPPVGSFQQSFGGGNWDMAIFKYDSTGNQLLYGTYLGGAGTEVPHSLVLNSKDELIIFGTTGSSDFPTTDNAINGTFQGGRPIIPIPGIPYEQGSDIVITRISEDGTQILSSTYLGGSDNDGLSSLEEFNDPLIQNYGDQVRGDVITDKDDNIYLATSTMSTDFLLTNSLFPSNSGGIRDAVLVKLNSNLDQMEWGTYIGGSGEDAAFSVKLDEEGNVLIAGATNSPDFPIGTGGFMSIFNGGIDGFVQHFENDGTKLTAGTFLGTPQNDLVYFSDFDTDGNVYLLGQSNGNYPITSGKYSNPNSQQFIQKLSIDLSTSIFSTQFGSGRGGPDLSTTAFLVNECNNLFVAGWGSNGSNFGTNSGYNGMNTVGLPVTSNAFQTETTGNDFYLAVFNAEMENLLYATFMGGTAAAPHVDGGTSRFDKRGVVYQSVCSCGGEQDNFPTTQNAWSTTNRSFPSVNGNGGNSPRCNNVVFKFDLATILAGIQTNTPEGDNLGIKKVCLPAPILFTNVSIGGENIEWNFGDGTIVSNKDSVLHFYQSEGEYNVTLRIEDLNTCRSVDFAYSTVEVFGDEISIMDDTSICQGDVLQLNATGAANYEWTLADMTISLEGFTPTVKPKESTQYFLVATTSNGCVANDSVFVEVIPSHQLSFNIEKQLPCLEFPSFEFFNKSTTSEGLIWEFGDGSFGTEGDTVVHHYASPGKYVAKLSLENPNSCTEISSFETMVEVFDNNIQVINDATICNGSEIILIATGGSNYEWNEVGNTKPFDGQSPTVSPDKNTRYILKATDLNGCVVEDSVFVKVMPVYQLEFDIEKKYSCSGLPTLTLINKSALDDGLTWNFGDGQTLQGPEALHNYDKAGSYTIELSYDPDVCTPPKVETVKIEEIFVPNAFSPNNDAFNEYFVINGPNKMALSVVNRLGQEVYKSDEYMNDWNAVDVPAGIYYYVLNLPQESQCNGWVQVFK